MVGFLASIVVALVLGLLVWRRGRDARVASVPTARWLRIAALVPLALQGLVFAMFGLGEMLDGDLSGAGHLLQLAVLGLVAFLVWQRPLEGGLALLAVGALQAASMGGALAAAPAGAVVSAGLVILALPMLVSGALLVIASLLARRQ